jgi:hypothetical protein
MNACGLSTDAALSVPPLQDKDGTSLSHIVSSQLRGTSSPFISIEPVPPTALGAAAAPQEPCEELHFVAEATAVAEWLSGGAVGLVLGQLGVKQGLDGLLACQEDAQRESKCRQAMASVQTFEANALIHTQVCTYICFCCGCQLIRHMCKHFVSKAAVKVAVDHTGQRQFGSPVWML